MQGKTGLPTDKHLFKQTEAAETERTEKPHPSSPVTKERVQPADLEDLVPVPQQLHYKRVLTTVPFRREGEFLYNHTRILLAGMLEEHLKSITLIQHQLEIPKFLALLCIFHYLALLHISHYQS